MERGRKSRLGSRIVFGWVIGGPLAHGNQPKEKTSAQLHSTQFLAKRSKPLNAAEPKKASIELVLPWRGLFESGWASGVVFGLVMGGCKPHGNKPTTKTSSPQQQTHPFSSQSTPSIAEIKRAID